MLESLFDKFAGLKAPTQVFSSKICEIFRNTSAGFFGITSQQTLHSITVILSATNINRLNQIHSKTYVRLTLKDFCKIKTTFSPFFPNSGASFLIKSLFFNEKVLHHRCFAVNFEKF